MFETSIVFWRSGGLLIYPLGLLAFAIYYTCFELYLSLRMRSLIPKASDDWSQWIEQPDLGKGMLGDVIRYTQNSVHSLDQVSHRFAELHNTMLSRSSRRVQFLLVLIGAAPLTGLLGTVAGMLSTFKGLSIQAGGQSRDFVAEGISQALITTQVGLVIAIPATVFVYLIKRRRQRIEAFLIRLESLTLQLLQQRLRKEELAG